jgi:hypothetical protein
MTDHGKRRSNSMKGKTIGGLNMQNKQRTVKQQENTVSSEANIERQKKL